MHIEYLQYPRHHSRNWGHSDDKRGQMPWNGHCAEVSRWDTPKPMQWEDPATSNDKSSCYLGQETATLLDRKPLFYPLWVIMFSPGFPCMCGYPSGLAAVLVAVRSLWARAHPPNREPGSASTLPGDQGPGSSQGRVTVHLHLSMNCTGSCSLLLSQ